MGELKEILGRGTEIEFGGRTWSVRPLTFNDLCDLEERFGDVASIDLSRASSQRYVLWVILRKSAGASGEEPLTEQAIGELLTLDEPKRIAVFIAKAFELSGLTRSEETTGGGDRGLQETPRHGESESDKTLLRLNDGESGKPIRAGRGQTQTPLRPNSGGPEGEAAAGKNRRAPKATVGAGV